jgi:hypothetical protein
VLPLREGRRLDRTVGEDVAGTPHDGQKRPRRVPHSHSIHTVRPRVGHDQCSPKRALNTPMYR